MDKVPLEVQETITKVIEAGAVGINFEDQVVGLEGLYSIEDQCSRIKAIREAAEHMQFPFSLTQERIFF